MGATEERGKPVVLIVEDDLAINGCWNC